MTTLTFQNKTLSVINQNNQMWMTVTEIGNALGYSDPFKSVKNIYDRHQDEFTPCMTALMDMQTNGGIQKVRIFSLRGCHLIGMLSHTKVAKDFRKWVLDILDKEVSQNNQPNLPLATAEKFINISICESDIRELAWIWFAGQQMADFISNLIRPLELLGSTDAPRAYSYANEYGNLLSGSIDLIEQLTKGIHFDNPTPLKRLKQAKEYREHRRKMVLNSREMVERITAKHQLAKR